VTSIHKTRREWFGGVVYSENPGFTAFVGSRRADSLGIALQDDLSEGLFSAPLDVHMSVTNRCNLLGTPPYLGLVCKTAHLTHSLAQVQTNREQPRLQRHGTFLGAGTIPSATHTQIVTTTLDYADARLLILSGACPPYAEQEGS